MYFGKADEADRGRRDPHQSTCIPLLNDRDVGVVGAKVASNVNGRGVPVVGPKGVVRSHGGVELALVAQARGQGSGGLVHGLLAGLGLRARAGAANVAQAEEGGGDSVGHARLERDAVRNAVGNVAAVDLLGRLGRRQDGARGALQHGGGRGQRVVGVVGHDVDAGAGAALRTEKAEGAAVGAHGPVGGLATGREPQAAATAVRQAEARVGVEGRGAGPLDGAVGLVEDKLALRLVAAARGDGAARGVGGLHHPKAGAVAHAEAAGGGVSGKGALNVVVELRRAAGAQGGGVGGGAEVVLAEGDAGLAAAERLAEAGPVVAAVAQRERGVAVGVAGLRARQRGEHGVGGVLAHEEVAADGGAVVVGDEGEGELAQAEVLRDGAAAKVGRGGDGNVEGGRGVVVEVVLGKGGGTDIEKYEGKAVWKRWEGGADSD